LKRKLTKKKKIVLTVICTGAGIILILPAAIAFLLTRAPAHYKPLTPPNPAEVSSYLTNYIAPEIHNKSQLDEPFELIITQQGLNDIIARGRWPIKLNGLTVSGPAVVLSANQITLMATVKYARIPAVVSIVMSPNIDEGGLLCLNLGSIKAGSFGITTLAKELTRKIAATYLGKIDGNPWANDITAAVLENKPFDPVFSAYDSEVRLTGLDISDGKAVLQLAPQANH